MRWCWWVIGRRNKKSDKEKDQRRGGGQERRGHEFHDETQRKDPSSFLEEAE
jgi:hypothetical protein